MAAQAKQRCTYRGTVAVLCLHQQAGTPSEKIPMLACRHLVVQAAKQ